MVPAPKEIEEALISKNYSELSPKTIENLAVYYIEREFYGSKIKYTLEEVATINKDEKLSRLLEEHIQLSPSSSPAHSFTNNNKSTHAFHKKSHEFEEQAQANLSIGASPVMNQVQANDNDHEYRLIEQRYHKDIDELSSLIEGKASYRELSRKLYYYKHFPHLSDQEIESYMSVEDKHQTQASQGKGFSHQNEQQIEE